MGQRIRNKQFNIPQSRALPGMDIELPCVILGDEAFGLHENLMKPFPRASSLRDKEIAVYNYRHSRGRRTTENTFGILCETFRIFHTPIIATPALVDNIITASCILHNLIRNSRPTKTNSSNVIPLPARNVVPIAPINGRNREIAVEIRNSFKNYFNGIGAVYWQEEAIGTNY